jgi:hypothetical protein
VRSFALPARNGKPMPAVLLSSLRGLSNSIAGFFEVTSGIYGEYPVADVFRQRR